MNVFVMTPVVMVLVGALQPVEPIQSVEVLWQTLERRYPVQGSVRVRVDEDVQLSVLVRFENGLCAVRGGVYVDPSGALRTCDLAESTLNKMRAVWMRIEPTSQRVHRGPRGGGTVPHASRQWATLSAARQVLAEMPDGKVEGPGVGAARFQVLIQALDGQVLGKSPGQEDPSRAFLLQVRAADDLLGVVQELLHVPHADSPRGAPPVLHETEQALCVDAVSVVLYGARRLGLPVGYAGWQQLEPFLEAVEQGGQPLTRGDVITRGHAVALLVEDRGRLGVLDGEDLVLTAETGPLRTLSWKQFPTRGPARVQRLRTSAPPVVRAPL